MFGVVSLTMGNSVFPFGYALAAQRDLYAVEHDVLDMVALAAGNDAVVNDNVFEITGALGADLERGGGRGQRTAREFFMVIPVKVI